jgi:predicted component of type VI protein secretion system
MRVERVGEGAPTLGDRAIVGDYVGPRSERLLVVVGSDSARAWRGFELTEDQYEVLPGRVTAPAS